MCPWSPRDMERLRAPGSMVCKGGQAAGPWNAAGSSEGPPLSPSLSSRLIVTLVLPGVSVPESDSNQDTPAPPNLEATLLGKEPRA